MILTLRLRSRAVKQFAPVKSFAARSVLLVAMIAAIACTSIRHDERLAARRAEEFARVAFVQHDAARAYALLSDSAKRYVPLETFKAALSRLHPKGFPTRVRAIEFQPMNGEKAVYIYLLGENPTEHFYYILTLEGTAATDYRVTTMNRSSTPFAPSTDRGTLGAL